jgi:hypothetical protein
MGTTVVIADPEGFQRRHHDVAVLGPLPETPYADAVLARLRDEGLIESVPGLGLVISARRLTFELETAHAAGKAGIT